ncbi:hypothetical protein BT96DRAFT_1022623 [Gymnopus androsaceus JB14]|uniref:Uncharacterized protein n=1 Tax=Gymnopus androsaceus JB14 TaxID=1447944 RepID=A0A6A4H863_9AGAR|nr:hypothetical protein BT96DRAFT_1022623 [Gymnopus androsaceus JB14]
MTSHQMFAQASNFEFNNSIFTTCPVNVTYHRTHQDANHLDHVNLISNILNCPSPSQYFVGREDVLMKLSKMFSAQIVTVWSANADVLHDFVRKYLKYPFIVLDASSAEILNIALQEKVKDQALPPQLLLVLENLDPSVVEGYSWHNFPDIPVLFTSKQPAISSLASSSTCAFHLHDHSDHQVVKKLLCCIEEALYPGQRVVTLVANGGTGKTQVILKFVSRNFSRFSNVWFFNATSNATLAADFKELGNAVGVGEDIKNIKNFLARGNQNWLCIFDSADDKDVFLNEYAPSGSHGNVIVTSCLTEISQMASPGCHIALGDLSQENAIELLLKQAHKESSDTNLAQASKIVDALGCHALAVATAGAYVGTTPLENYLQHFNKKKTKILNYRMRSLDGYQETTYSAFQLSFEKLSPSTKLLMQLCTYLHPTAIPMEIFTRAAAFTGSDSGPVDLNPPIQAMKLLGDFLSMFAEEESWEDSVVELCQLSLASYNTFKKCLDFHPVIHTCISKTILNEEYMSQTAMLLLGRAIPLGVTEEDYQFRHKLIIDASHIQTSKLPTVHVKKCLARVFYDSGFWSLSEKLEEDVLQLHKQGLGEHHPDTLTAMSDLAGTYRTLGKNQAAERLTVQVLQLCKQVAGEHHPQTLDIMANLAVIYRKLGKLDMAEKLGEEVLQLLKQIIGKHHPDTLQSMADLAMTYQKLGKYEVAEKLQEKVLRLHKQVIGKYHPDTLSSMAKLAMTYRKLGKVEAARELQEEALQLRKQVLGEHHPNTLISMANLANTYRKLGNSQTAKKLQKEMLQLRR